MDYTLLGKSTLEISRIGFGAMSLKAGKDANAKLLHEAVAVARGGGGGHCPAQRVRRLPGEERHGPYPCGLRPRPPG